MNVNFVQDCVEIQAIQAVGTKVEVYTPRDRLCPFIVPILVKF